jgi:hypothetical protein
MIWRSSWWERPKDEEPEAKTREHDGELAKRARLWLGFGKRPYAKRHKKTQSEAKATA